VKWSIAPRVFLGKLAFRRELYLSVIRLVTIEGGSGKYLYYQIAAMDQVVPSECGGASQQEIFALQELIQQLR